MAKGDKSSGDGKSRFVMYVVFGVLAAAAVWGSKVLGAGEWKGSIAAGVENNATRDVVQDKEISNLEGRVRLTETAITALKTNQKIILENTESNGEDIEALSQLVADELEELRRDLRIQSPHARATCTTMIKEPGR